MSQGDLREQESFNCYRLTRDKLLLEYIYEYKEIIKYVIFMYNQGFEIIKVDNIPYILKLIPWKYIISPLRVKNVSTLYNMNIPIDDQNDG